MKPDIALTKDHTVELKGLAILAIIFAHVGYQLIPHVEFLKPFSFYGGPGVDIFLFLSGFGLAFSMLRDQQSVVAFYKKRLSKLFVPMWIVLILAFAANYLLQGRVFSLPYMISSFLGIFPTARILTDINSPLWYFTFILGYYLLFPIVFSKKRPWLSSIILFLAGYLLILLQPTHFQPVLDVYKLHIVAFPLGVLVAWLMSRNSDAESYNFLRILSPGVKKLLVSISLLLLVLAIGYLGIYSGVGKGWETEQAVSLLTAALVIIFVMLKPIRVYVFSLFGKYSYEIYLTHWPIAYLSLSLWRNVSYEFITLIYLVVVLFVSIGLHRLTNPAEKS